MKKILVIGAGKSATVLIDYVLKNSAENKWELTVGDLNEHLAQQKVKGYEHATGIYFDVNNEEVCSSSIAVADVVISMLPASLHMIVAKQCLTYGKHLLTASYLTEELYHMSEDCKRAGVLFMGEMGLDPGIDHMSAIQEIHAIQQTGGKITSFKSYTGGLVAPESDNNPWNYKFSWNPRNVILAGLGTARYLGDQERKYIPYHRIFTQTEKIEIPGYGIFEGYANRDSLHYINTYDLQQAKTMLRGTLRKEGFCEAWNVFVQLGMTADDFLLKDLKSRTYQSVLAGFLPEIKGDVKKTFKQFVGGENGDRITAQFEWLGWFSDKTFLINEATPAKILQHVLEDKWKLEPEDKDMIVMYHQIGYELEGRLMEKKLSLVVIGEDQEHTAMAKTVGLPLGILAKLLLSGQIKLTGVHIPILPEIYNPVLKELEEYGVAFKEN